MIGFEVLVVYLLVLLLGLGLAGLFRADARPSRLAHLDHRPQWRDADVVHVWPRGRAGRVPGTARSIIIQRCVTPVADGICGVERTREG